MFPTQNFWPYRQKPVYLELILCRFNAWKMCVGGLKIIAELNKQKKVIH